MLPAKIFIIHHRVPGVRDPEQPAFPDGLHGCLRPGYFRRFVFEIRFLKIFNIAPEIVERVKTDDEELARLAFLWLKFGMSDKNALEIRPEVLQQQGDLVQNQK